MKLEARQHINTDVSRETVEDVVRAMSYPDWLILYYLSMSMDKKNFGALIKKLAIQQKEDCGSEGDDGSQL